MKEKRDQFNQLHNKWSTDVLEWVEEIKRKANEKYSNDESKMRKQAIKLAKSAAGEADLSVLRGRGAEFVLEFTAVVVIIFSATILGILGILKEQHIGTLLAAIAGYVLGRATTEARKGKSDEGLGEAKPKEGPQQP